MTAIKSQCLDHLRGKAPIAVRATCVQVVEAADASHDAEDAFDKLRAAFMTASLCSQCR